MDKSLKQKTVSGILWSGIERFSTQGIQFVIEMVMARLLLPSDYGLIGMLVIFMAVSNTFIDSGFSNALIQKQNRTQADLSTVFYFNIIISVVLYVALFYLAPLISLFYETPALTQVVRIYGLTLIIGAFSAVNRTVLVIEVDFKSQSKISLFSIFISGALGIFLAIQGFGVWALVWMSIGNLSLQAILFFYFVKWRPSWVFSIQSFQSLFSFGSKLLLTSLLGSLYDNLYTIVIGKKFKTTDLGYYTKSEQFARLPSTNLAFIISRVSFPILSAIQDDNERLTTAYKKYLSLSSMLVFPIMITLAVLANPIVVTLFTEKWTGMVLLLQILCFDWMWDPMSKININLLLVKGKSNLILKLEIFKRIISVSILVLTLPFGLIGLAVGRVIYSFLAIYINSYYTGKTIHALNYFEQMKIAIPFFLIAVITGAVIFSVILLFDSLIIQMIVGVVIGVLCYFVLLAVLKREELNEFILLFKQLIKVK